MDIDALGNKYSHSYSTATQLPDELLRMERNNLAGNGNWNEFAYDRDGRVIQKTWPGDSGGSPAFGLEFVHVSDAAIGPGADTVFKSVGVNSSYYNYWYDSQSRRRRKDYPVEGVTDEFFYDQGHSMLEDRGNISVLGGTEYPIDEYVWLSRRPVAIVRAKFNAAWQRQSDSVGACVRNGSPGSCGLFFPVTDHVGKPVLMLDASRRIAGTGEYDNFGQLNRAQAWGPPPNSGESGHPYPYNGVNDIIADFTQPTLAMGLSVRTHFTQMDTEARCGQTWDYAQIENGDNGSVMSGRLGGSHKGDYWSPWVTAPSTGHLKVRFLADSINCAPGDGCGCSTHTYPYSGVALREYEYQRYQSVSRWGSSSAWKQTLAPAAGWEQLVHNDSGWGASVEEVGYGGSPWGTGAGFPSGTPAKWIWYYDSRASSDTSTVYFRKTFTATTSQATLTITADDSFIAYLNGVQVATGSYWPASVTTTLNLTVGAPYVLAVRAVNGGGAGGLLVDVNEPASFAWTALRFPGQYYDEETDLFENWNRFYDPSTGRYLSPEPMLQEPDWVRSEAQDGFSAPTYAYARNNPTGTIDENGLWPSSINTPAGIAALAA
ncbi:MAG: RHS repeat-associated core domain-containing protein, partial [Archangium sp.]|nr:RHS repeat-associated core domain-containing protein [Archangium sp.]